jgi:hypothetical protein
MITCVLVDDDGDDHQTILEFETTELPAAGDTVEVSDLRGREWALASWRVLPHVRCWAAHIRPTGEGELRAVFVRCTKESA